VDQSTEKDMKKIWPITLCITFVVFCFSAQAQEMKKVSRIGFLTLIAKPDPLESVFLQGLRDLGYVEGTKH